MKALFQSQLDNGRIRCDLCPHRCVLSEGEDGRCRARGVRNGSLEALYYGVVSSAGLDPVEKKPLYHFHPGGTILSIGGWGCNLGCEFCQNWTISQQAGEGGKSFTPSHVAADAVKLESVGIAYTYNEPLVGYEFVRDCAVEVREAGLANVLVTNGFLERVPAEQILPLVDALNIDIKSMDDEFYRKTCHGRLDPVLRFSERAVRAGCHVEITNLVVPGLNDGEERFAKLAEWIRVNLGRKTPLHLSAYHPQYKMDREATPVDMLELAHGVCRQSLDYVYVGNVRTGSGQDTACPGCGAVLIARRGYHAEIRGIEHGACRGCRRAADVIGLLDRQA